MSKTIKNLEQIFEKKRQLLFSATASSILFSLLLFLPFFKKTLVYTPALNQFSNHVMSWATASDISIASRINSYYLLISGIIVFSILFFFIILKVFSERHNEETLGIYKYIKELSFVGIAGVAASILSASQEPGLYFVGGAVLFGWIYLRFSEKKCLDITMLTWYMLMSIPLTLCVWVVSRKLFVLERIVNNTFFQKLELQVDVIYFVIVWFLISVILFFLTEIMLNLYSVKLNMENEDIKYTIITAGIPIILTGIIQSAMLEMLNIINKRFDIIFDNPSLMYIVLLVLSGLVMAIIINRQISRRKSNFNKNKKVIVYKFYLPVILVTFILMIVQPTRMALVGNEYFEMANHGLSVDHLFRYGSIPIIETFDAHMLSNQIFAYLYSLFNGYEPWAAFLYNPYMQIINMLVLFYLLKSFIGEVNSLFFILTFPLLGNLFSTAYLLSGILVFSILKCFKKGKEMQGNYSFWITIIILCIYRLDLGVAALMGGVATYLVISCMYKRGSGYFKFLFSGAICGISGVLLFIMLCLFKGVNAKKRIVEFIKLCQSNQNWAYPSVGDNNLIAFTLGYYIFPVFMVIILILTIAKFTLKKNELIQVNQKNLIMFLFFSAFFIFNISRGIVRHSLAEGDLMVTLGTCSIAIMAFIVMKNNDESRVGKFLIASIITVILVNVNFPTFNEYSSTVTKAFASKQYQEQYEIPYAFNGTRVRGELPSDARQLKEILDATLNDEETYFDFSSTNYFYSLVKRENPIYANQSPLMISDDKTQEFALDEFKAKNPPIVLMPIASKEWSSIDTIAVDYKYYMLSEYIYEGYTPLIRLPSFDVYVLKAKRDEFIKKIDDKGLTHSTIFKDNFKKIDLEKIISHNIVVEKNAQGYMKLKENGEDPYIIAKFTDLLNTIPDDPKYNNNKPTKLKIDFEASKPGKLQLFYTLNENEDFSEIQSKTYDHLNEKGGSVELEIPSMFNKIRIDINGTDITLKEMSINQGIKFIKKQPEAWTRELGYIPLLWGERDGNKAYQNAPYLHEAITDTTQVSFGTQGIIKGQPLYLILQIDSEATHEASIEIGAKSNNKVGEFKFNLSKGKHDYVIRLSTDYKWWNDEVDYITFGTDEIVSIHKFSYFAERKGEYYNSEQQLQL